MSLIQKVKQQKTKAAQMHAIVELAMLGRATVVLIGSNRRMTNLPVYGKSVTTGDEVIVDYSSEGTPYVRASIEYELEPEPEVQVIFAEAPVSNNDGFMAGKVTLSSDQSFSGTVAGSIFTWTPILFNEVLYDNLSLWNPSAGFFGEMPTGQYVASVNLGFQYYGYASGYFAVQLINYKASTGAITPIDFRMPFSKNAVFQGGSDHNIDIVNFTTLCRISDADEAIGLAFCVNIGAYINPTVIADYSVFSLHKLKNLDPLGGMSTRGWWDSGTYF